MKKILFQIKSLLIICIMIISAMPYTASANSGRVYYVAANGSDLASGTQTSPFATISHAAEIMQAGDTCYIREGVYYETLDMNLNGTKENKISFKAYNGEKVTLSGGVPLNNFKQHDGNIYSADMSWDIYSGNGNMIFADGELCLEARWPNATVNDLLDRSTYAKVESASALTIKDSNLPDVDLTNAHMWIANGPSYWSTLVNINSYNTTEKTLTIDDVFSSATYRPAEGNLYYITRNYALLDSPGEWYKDISGKKLYFYAPDGVNPNNMKIEARKREYVINLSASSYVEFYGINIRGGLVNFTGTTNNCRFSDAVIESLDYRMRTGVQSSARGVVIGGNNNKLSGCEIKNMFGEGVTLQGNNNYVVNNYIHDINFEHTYSDGVYITGENHLVSRNTITKTGRSTIGGKFEDCVISHNDLSDSCRISKDGGTLYFNAYDYRNSEIHHNVIHDAMNNEGLQYGLYLDSFTTSMIVYNNLVYGMEPDDLSDNKRLTLCVNPNSLNTVFVNNTFVNTRPANTHGGSTYDLSGCVFINNLFRSQAHVLSEEELSLMDVIFKNNLQGSTENFLNDINSDFSLADGSNAIDAGMYVPGINDDFLGIAPDCGAFEYGKEKWTAGHDFSKDYEPEFKLNEKIPYRNVLPNGGFENDLDGWDGNGEIFTSNSWTMWGKFSKDGEKALKLSENDSLNRKVTGLKPYTSYKIGGYAFLGTEFIGGNEYSEVYDKYYRQIDRLSDSMPLGGIGNVGILKYNVDFGENSYDKLVLGLRYHKKGQKITVKKESVLSRAIATINETSNSSSVGWKWYEVDLNEALSGEESLLICLESGDFSSTLIAGFYAFSSDGEDNVVVKGVSDNGEEKEIIFTAPQFEKPMPSAYIITGAKGEIDISIKKNGNTLFGYADYINITENSEGIMNSEQRIITAGSAIRDINGELKDGFTAGELNFFETAYINTTDEYIPLEGIMLLYDNNDTLVSISSVEYGIEAKNKSNILLGKQIGKNIGKVKILAWKSLESLNPITVATTFYSTGKDN